MLVIRDAQLEVFRRRGEDRFVERMVARVAVAFPSRFARLKVDGIRALVRDAMQVGARDGVRSETAVALLIELWVTFGAQLERSPEQAWALELLAHPRLPDTLKLQLMHERLTALSAGRPVVSVDEDEVAGS